MSCSLLCTEAWYYRILRRQPVYTTHPWDDFPCSIFARLESCRCPKSQRWNHIAESFLETYRSVFAPSWLSSNQASKTAPGCVCDIHSRTTTGMQRQQYALTCCSPKSTHYLYTTVYIISPPPWGGFPSSTAQQPKRGRQ